MGDLINANQSITNKTICIFTKSFKCAYNTLIKNGRPGTSSLLVAGAWIEGFYIACQTAKETNNEPMIKEIFNQNESLTNLIELVEVSKVTDEAIYVLTDLKELKKIIDGKTDKVYTAEALKNIDSKVTELRTKIISNK